MAAAGAAVVWSFASQVELTSDDFDDLTETTFICTSEVQFECDADNAANRLALEGDDRLKVEYAEIPEVVVQAVVATEDKSFFEHEGVDPVGLTRAVYQTAKQRFTGSGSVQGGSTITQQYIKLTSQDDADEVARKAREIVRAIKFEQELADELGSKEAAKERILERYLNRIYFGRRAYGIAAAARAYFDKELSELSIAESAYLAGLIRNPSRGDASEYPDEAQRRRSVSLTLMEEAGFITAEQRQAAENEPWTSLVRGNTVSSGLGDSLGSEYGTDFFISSVRNELNDIFPNGEYYAESMRVYTTLDHDLQRLAYNTITGRLDPNNPDMPLGSLVSIDGDGRVVAMMGGADWQTSQVNLATAEGGTGFQPGSLMKPIVLAEFIEQGFSPESYFEAPFTTVFDLAGGDQWKVSGGGTSKVPNHRTVYDATRWSSNTVYAQMMLLVQPDTVVDMAQRLGIEAPIEAVPSLVLGAEEVPPLDMASAFSTFEREGVHMKPALIDRIEDSEGNVLCWYPIEAGDCDGRASAVDATRQGDQAIEGRIARQVNGALLDVVANGTGKAAALVNEAGEVRPAAGKTGTTQNYRDAWFTGFSCDLTTSVWMGYPGVDGEEPRFMSNGEVATLNASRAEQGLEPLPNMSELFGGDYDNITGGSIPAEMWHDYMLAATADDGPCEIPSERPGPDQRILGQDLLTTLAPCAEPDPALVAAAQQAQSTSSGDGGGGEQPPADGGGGGEPPADDGGGGEGEDALGPIINVSLGGRGFGSFSGRAPMAFQGPKVFQDNGGEGGNGGGGVTPTTAPCLPIDLNGNVIGDGTTTTVDPAGPSTQDTGTTTTIDPNATSSTTIDPNNTTTTAPPTTTPPTTASTTTAETQPENTVDPGNGNGRGNGGGGAGD